MKTDLIAGFCENFQAGKKALWHSNLCLIPGAVNCTFCKARRGLRRKRSKPTLRSKRSHNTADGLSIGINGAGKKALNSRQGEAYDAGVVKSYAEE